MHSPRIFAGGAVRSVFLLTFLGALAMARYPLQAEKLNPDPPPEPNCANGRLLCRVVSSCTGGWFDNTGKCSSGNVFSVHYYYRDT